jgi:hydrogenase maturation protease
MRFTNSRLSDLIDQDTLHHVRMLHRSRNLENPGSCFFSKPERESIMIERRILVLGVGNILLKDEGIGVRIVEKLQADYRCSQNVELLDGGTLGLSLLTPIASADYLIVVDAVQNGQPPGTIYRLSVDVLEKRISFKNSLHQLDLVETLAYAEMVGTRPEAVIIGIEPEDISPWGLELTSTIQTKFSELCARVVEEIQSAGGWCQPISQAIEGLPTRSAG